MSRNQFVKNTLTAIQTQVNPSSPDIVSPSSADLTSYDDCSVRGATLEDTAEYGAPTVRSKRSDSITSWNSVSRDPATGIPTTPSTASVMNGGSTPSFQNGQDLSASASSQTYGRALEVEMESLLKVSRQSLFSPFSTDAMTHRKCTTPSRASRSCNPCLLWGVPLCLRSVLAVLGS